MIDSVSNFGAYGVTGVTSASYKNDVAKTSEFEKAINAASESGEDEKLMEAAREFESYFLQMVLKEMRKTVPKDGLIPKSTAEEIFEGMLDEEYSKNAAKGKGMGLAQMIYEQMTKRGSTAIPPAAALSGIAGASDKTIDASQALENTIGVDNIIE